MFHGPIGAIVIFQGAFVILKVLKVSFRNTFKGEEIKRIKVIRESRRG